MRKGKLIVIVAPSGSGKSTLIKRLKRDLPQLTESVSYTTRPIRSGEVDGVSYNFVSLTEFNEREELGDFIESASVHDNFYGTSKSFLEKIVSEGRDLLFDLDVQGADSFKKYFQNDVKIIFIAPPSYRELEKRLRKRGTDNAAAIEIRLENAKSELQRKDDYDFCVVNDDLEKCFLELKEVFENIVRG